MAYALSHLHSLIRGSVGGLTYFANQFHQICMRQRTSPVQPNTPHQTGIRTAFNLAEARWESITPEARQAWQDYASTCIYPGPAGPYAVPGRQLMIGTLALATYANAIGPELFVMSPYAPEIAGWFNPGSIGVGVYNGPTQGIAVNVYNGTGRLAVAVVDVSIAFNLTRNRYKGPWLSIDKVVGLVGLGSEHISVDRPAGTLNKVVFTRTRLFSAQHAPGPEVPHALAFPAFLRHIVSPPQGNNGNDKPKKKKEKTDK